MDGHEQLAVQIAHEVQGKNPYLMNELQLLSAILEELKKPVQTNNDNELLLVELRNMNRKQEK